MKAPLLAVCAAATLLSSACGGGSAADSESNAAPTLPETSAADTSAPTTAAGPSRNARGNIVKALGEEGGFSNLETDETIVTFALNSIAPAECDEYYDPAYSPPENGNLASISLRFATAPELADSELGQYFSVSASDFQFVGADGITTTNLGTLAAFSCQGSGAGAFPQSQLAPGSAYTGSIVLDLPAPSGVLMYRPAFVNGGGWEWQF